MLCSGLYLCASLGVYLLDAPFLVWFIKKSFIVLYEFMQDAGIVEVNAQVSL